MPLIRLLQIVVAALAAMGTMLLGMGQREIGMTMLMILAAGLSVWLTDIKGWLYLNRNVANLIMLGVALFSLRDIFHIYSEMQALTFAQFLIYLQIILLFQKKDSRTFWLIIMLSLLQVVVAALFSQGVFFGILLMMYMLLACLALTLLMLNRQSEPQKVKTPGLFSFSLTFGKKSEPKEMPQKTAFDSARREPRPPGISEPRPVGISEPRSLGMTKSDSGTARAVSRWPLIDQQPELDGASVSNTRQGVGGDLYRRLFGMMGRTLALTMVLFIVVPRFGQVGWRGGFTATKATVGFNPQVTLGEMGQIIESPSEVMRIRFYDGKSERPYSTSGEIYLYGGLLMEYSKGRWSTGTPAIASNVGGKHVERVPGEELPKSYVTQKCDLESLDRSELFFVAPYVPLEYDDIRLIVDEKLCRLIRSDNDRRQKFIYRLGTTAFRNGIQSPLTPRNRSEWVDVAKQYPKYRNGQPSLEQLKKLADKWIAESKLPPDDAVGRARYLEQKLASSGEYSYSMVGQKRDPSMDPIEDFLVQHKSGHCEYFATALTLLLRHAGIPARLVVGFKCDEWHEAEQCYQVRQLHAHTWVQAYLSPEQLKRLPQESLHGQDKWKWEENGGWLRLDPTPARDLEAKNGIFTPIAKGLQWLDFNWSYYVVELNSDRQRKAIFDPIANAVTKVFETLGSRKTWRNIFERIYNSLHTPGMVGGVAWVLLIVTILATVALLILIGMFVWLLGRKLWRRFSGRRRKLRHGPRIEVEFYRRLEHLFKKNGLIRPLGQTPREFAFAAGAWLAAETGQPRLNAFPGRIVDAYYHVRFGRLPLEDGHWQEVDQLLKEMETQIANRKAISTGSQKSNGNGRK